MRTIYIVKGHMRLEYQSYMQSNHEMREAWQDACASNDETVTIVTKPKPRNGRTLYVALHN